MGVLLGVGLVSGFCSSAPLGPINLWLVEALIADTKKAVIWFLTGVVITDLFFAWIAMWGYQEYLKDSGYTKHAQVLAGVFLVLVGIFTVTKLLKNSESARRAKRGARHGVKQSWKNLAFGATLCGSNPAFLMFWLFVVNFVNQSMDLQVTEFAQFLFLVGVALGDTLWFGLLAKLVKKGLNLAKPSILLGIRYVIALSFFAFGGAALWQSMV